MPATPRPPPLPDLVNLLLDAVFLVDAGGCVVYANAACERMFGYTPDEFIGRRLLDFIAPEDRERTLAEVSEVLTGRPRIGFENRYLHKDGRRVRVMWSACWSETAQLRIGVARDVTELRHAEAIQAATYAISEAAHDADDLALLLDEIHRIVAGLVPVAGVAVATRDRRSGELGFSYHRDAQGGLLPLDEPLACRYCGWSMRGGRPLSARDAALAAMGGQALSCEERGCWLAVPLVAQQDTIGALVLKCAPDTHYSERDKALLHFVAAQVAIAIDRAQLKAELLRAARYDELTGLANRRLVQDRIRSAIVRAARNGGGFALLYVDLDKFKQVNDTLGHACGDLLLQAVARRLQQCVRASDTVGRLGGDEFVVLLEEVDTRAAAEALVHKLRREIGQPLELGASTVAVAASIGIALYPADGDGVEALLAHADQAMYAEKRSKGQAGTAP